MIDTVKTALRIRHNLLDNELADLIATGKAELSMLGIIPDDTDPLVRRCIVTYCYLNCGHPDDYDRMKRSYDEQKAQLLSAHKYRGALHE